MALSMEEKRARNLARIMGNTEKVVTPYTNADLAKPEVCWDILSMCVRPVMSETTGKNGKTYKRATSELQFPELMKQITVGVRKNAKGKVTAQRSNLKTIKEMYSTRNTLIAHYEDDIDDDYIEFFKEAVEAIDGYALQVCADAIEADEQFLTKVNAARGC